MNDITTFHNRACGTSGNVLALIRNGGVETVVDAEGRRVVR